MDARTLIAQQIGFAVIANAEQAALIEKLQAELAEAKKLLAEQNQKAEQP